MLDCLCANEPVSDRCTNIGSEITGTSVFKLFCLFFSLLGHLFLLSEQLLWNTTNKHMITWIPQLGDILKTTSRVVEEPYLVLWVSSWGSNPYTDCRHITTTADVTWCWPRGSFWWGHCSPSRLSSWSGVSLPLSLWLWRCLIIAKDSLKSLSLKFSAMALNPRLTLESQN